MPLKSDLTLNYAKFDPSAVDQKTKDFNQNLIDVMAGIPRWYEVQPLYHPTTQSTALSAIDNEPLGRRAAISGDACQWRDASTLAGKSPPSEADYGAVERCRKGHTVSYCAAEAGRIGEGRILSYTRRRMGLARRELLGCAPIVNIVHLVLRITPVSPSYEQTADLSGIE